MLRSNGTRPFVSHIILCFWLRAIDLYRVETNNQFVSVSYDLTYYRFITALHVMQTRYCDEISVGPSVRLSVCHTRGL